jgi:hypothetical protein
MLQKYKFGLAVLKPTLKMPILLLPKHQDHKTAQLEID